MVGQLTAVTLDLSLGLFHLYLLSPLLTDQLHGVFEDEDGVKDGDGGEAKVNAKEWDVAKESSYASAKRTSNHETKARNSRNEAEPRRSWLIAWHVRDVAGQRQVEDRVAPGEVLQALEEDVLHLELHEEDGVDHEDQVEDEEASERDHYQWLSPIRVRERTCWCIRGTISRDIKSSMFGKQTVFLGGMWAVSWRTGEYCKESKQWSNSLSLLLQCDVIGNSVISVAPKR